MASDPWIVASKREKEPNEKNSGDILTPGILAEDMVRISLIEWLSANSGSRREQIIDFVYGSRNAKKTSLREKCKEIKWYDPCIGEGAFPLAIIKVYRELGITDMPLIYGHDINPYYVDTAIKRIAMVCGEEWMPLLADRFTTEDVLALPSYGECFRDASETEEKYDITIGNPPYVRENVMEKSLREIYKENFPELDGKSTDLYVYFICHGLNVLTDTGVLTFVTPAQFQTSHYGKPVRRIINEKCDLKVIADFGELPVFKNVSVHTSVYCLSRKKEGRNFLRYEYTSLPGKQPLLLLYQSGAWLPQQNLEEEGWIFSSANGSLILDFLEKSGAALKEYSEGVFSGIKTGCKKAFFIRSSEMENYSEYDMSYCEKMIVPKKICAWKSIWSDDFLALIEKNEKLEESSGLYARMLVYQDKLKARVDVEGHETWYGLRQCSYYDKFKQPKIIYPDISTECRFSMDTESYLIPDGAFFIPGEDYYLLGILNSCIGRYYFRQKCARIGNPRMGGRIRFKKVYVENFPVALPETNPLLAEKIAQIAKKSSQRGKITSGDSKKLDILSSDMYRIPPEYREIIQEY